MDRRLKNGLAWAGVVLVCAIPAADWLTQQFSAPKAANVSVAPTEAASTPAPAATPEVTQTAAAAEPVAPVPAAAKPRKMPSYISDAGDGETIEDVAATTPRPAAPVATPAAPKPETAQQQPPRVVPGATPPANDVAATEPKVVIDAPADRGTSNVPAPVRDVASVTVPNGAVFSPDIIAPIPMPASMRPATRPVDPVRTGNVVPPDNAMTPVNGAGYGSDDEVISRDDIITAEDLEDWESGPLSEFLARRQNQAGNSAPRSRYAPPTESDYDPNGFFLSDGPNVDRRPPADIIYPYGGY